MEQSNERRVNQMTDNRIKQIADCNGMEVILNKLTEEAGELITAIARYQSKWVDPNNEKEELFADLVEEAADTMIMLEQLRLQTDLFDRVREAKINRQIERMGKE